MTYVYKKINLRDKQWDMLVKLAEIRSKSYNKKISTSEVLRQIIDDYFTIRG